MGALKSVLTSAVGAVRRHGRRARQPVYIGSKQMKRRYFHQLLIAIDQLVNAALFGWADETLSSRAYRTQYKRRWRVIMRGINGIFFWQEDHCRDAYLFERDKGHVPPEFRE